MGFLNQALTLLLSNERVPTRALPGGIEFIDVRSSLGVVAAPRTGCVGRPVFGSDQRSRARTPFQRRKTALIAPEDEAEPEDLRGSHYRRARLGNWGPQQYEANTGQVIADVQWQVRRPTVRWAGATLDGRVEAAGAAFEAKSILPGRSRSKPPPNGLKSK